MIERKYYCDWCGKEMSKLYYFTGSHLVIFGRFNYDETAITDNEDCICKECYEDFKELRSSKQESRRNDMRSFDKEEQKNYTEAINKIYKPTGVKLFNK